ncbi:hypothetical protein [Parasedimentitalea psychrophila]|uniref:Co-chaperone DjlA N-terminal domain-containing protein n=1 Tax=Parasedimentitalea psychrophila TaxID=2997337 RepID=A0A9Y2P1D2_9RHOB|nr:hypothetical protein [Parasedimentitalea psychrophila]WIY25486.1 hypothetical protein QPJ95_00575 [Parasedimentitalea psychrophila]
MPLLIAIIGIAAAVYFFLNRARNAALMAGDLVDVAKDVKLAARRFGFRRQANMHPVESVEDRNLAIAALAIAFQELNGKPGRDQGDKLICQLQRQLGMDSDAAEDAAILGRWLVSQCGGTEAALARLSRKVYRLGGAETLQPLMDIVNGSLSGNGLSPRQKDAMEGLRSAFRKAGS